MPVTSLVWNVRREAVDVAADIEEKHRQCRARWSDFAVLYRSHLHRDELVRELGMRGIPFAIENMDVLDTPEVRDVLACVGAVDSEADAASLLRVAALPQFPQADRLREEVALCG